jgi:hypothetical protein
LTEPGRISCCINGCRRTFKAEVAGDSSLYMCGKHFRCDLELLGRIRRIKRRLTKIERKFKRLCARAITEDDIIRYEHVLDTLAAMHNTVFDEIRREAQRQQDAGFFAPKPRRRGAVRDERTTDPLAARFDDQFQRLKRAQVGA